MLRIIIVSFAASSCCVTVPISLAGDALRYSQCPAHYGVDVPPATSVGPIRPDAITPRGIRVDRSGFDVDLARLDAIITRFEECMGATVHACAFRVKVHPGSFERSPGLWSVPGPDVTTGWSQGHDIISTPDWSPISHELVHQVLRRADHAHGAFARCGR